jgi:hypothetical protein
MILFAFDFDGTVTNVPGQFSDIFSKGKGFSKLNFKKIFHKMKDIFIRYIPKEKAEKFRKFFKEINNYPGSAITIQTNNYKNVVISCLVYHLKVPLSHIDFERSCFRECKNYKHKNINQLAKDDKIEKIYYFEDSEKEIKRIKNREKVKVIFCDNGMSSLSELLEKKPVEDQKSLSEFLEQFSD